MAGLGGTVWALAEYNGELYAGGEWFVAKGGVIRGLARFDGVDWQPVGTGVDLVNYTFPPSDVRVAAMTVYNGELVFAGTFDRVGGQAISYIARWNGAAFAPLGAGLSLSFDEADVRALAVFNNELYAAGQFDLAGGQPAAGIARWNGSAWSPVGSGLRMAGGAAVGYPRALHVHGNELIAGGVFGLAGGLTANNIARWNGTSWLALAQGSFAPVYALETFGTQLIAAGQFQIGGFTALPGAWNGTSWSAVGSNPPGLPSVALRTFGSALFADGGQTVWRFDGATWSNVGVVSGIYNGVLTTNIRTLQTVGGELLVGGQFTRAGSIPNLPLVASAGAVAFDGVSTWRTLGTGEGLDRRIVRLLPWRGSWFAAGQFSEAGGAPAVGLARYDGDRWQLFARVDGGVIYDAAIHQDGLVVTGNFSSIAGQAFPGVARYDGAAWHPFGTFGPPGLHAHAGELYAFGGSALTRWNGTSFAVVATPPSGSIDALHSHSDGSLYAANNDSVNHRVLRWTGSQLQPIGTANNSVQVLGSYGGELLAGGRFSSIGGAAAALIGRWNGSQWSAMPSPVSGFSADAFCEFDGDLYAGVNGDPRGFLLRLRNGTWSGLGAGIDGVPRLLFADPAVASVFASGDILNAGGVPSRSLAEWRTQPDWRDRLRGLAGANGEPRLSGRGAAQSGATLQWTIAGPVGTLGVLAFGFTRVDAPALGGTLVPSPDATFAFVTDALGSAPFALQLPTPTSPGIDVFAQAWLLDASGPQGLTATNALQCTTR
ncbi:MAG: hypothetical protein H6835_17525 [Planctomycetes bacterium]|nr:hypothetical protein [Planctomycetota bacterium]